MSSSSEVFRFAVLNDISKKKDKNDTKQDPVQTSNQVTDNSLHNDVKNEYNAKLKEQKNTSDNFVNTDKEIEKSLQNVDDIPSELVEKRAKLYQNLVTSESKTKNKIRLLARDYVNSKNFVDLSNVGIEGLMNWLNKQEDSITWKKFNDSVNQFMGNPPSELISMDKYIQTKQNVADSLLASVILGDEIKPDVVDRLTKLSRIYFIIDESLNHDPEDSFSVKTILSKRVLLPKHAFSKSFASKIPSASVLQANYNHLNRKKLIHKLRKYGIIQKELENITPNDLELKEKKVKPPVLQKKLTDIIAQECLDSKFREKCSKDPKAFEVITAVSKERYERLSPETKEFIKEEGFDTEFFTPDEVITVLEDKTLRTQEELYKFEWVR